MKLTWCRRRRPTWSVRRWSSLSTKRDSLGTRIQPKTRKKMTKTNTGRRGRGEERNCSFELHCTLERVFWGSGGGAETSKTRLDSFVFWCSITHSILLLSGYNPTVNICLTKPSPSEMYNAVLIFSINSLQYRFHTFGPVLGHLAMTLY